MKDRINELIIKQLGELPKVKNTNGSFNYTLVRFNYRWIKLYFESNKDHLDKTPYEIWCELYIKEEEKRELLGELIDNTLRWFNTPFYMQAYPKDLPDNIKLIEKSLSMKWPDIVIFLEGEG